MSFVEISDHIAIWDAQTGARQPVRRSEVIEVLDAAGDRRGVRIVRGMRAEGDVLDDAAVDALLLRVHRELQRLNEELRHGERAAAMLRPMVDMIRALGIRQPIRIVDIGCGLGYVIRWLAAHDVLGPGIELVGSDINGALITEAQRLAKAEDLRCDFVHADAFAIEPATIYLSTGVVHHFRNRELDEFFAAQARVGVIAACHYDIAPTRLAPLGALVFHLARMRCALSRHDGVVSALRAHPDDVLVGAARRAMPGFVPLLFDPVDRRPANLTVLRPLIALRPGFVTPLREALGTRTDRLVVPP